MKSKRVHERHAIHAVATPQQNHHAALPAASTRGFPAMVRAMTWVNDVLGK